MAILQSQIQILSVDTGNFYSNREAYLHWYNHKLRMERNSLLEKIKPLKSELAKNGIDEKQLNGYYRSFNDDSLSQDVEQYEEVSKYCTLRSYVELKGKKIKQSKEKLLTLLSNKVDVNIEQGGKHHTRVLRNVKPASNELADVFKHCDEDIGESNHISVFESAFTRTIGAKLDELSEDFMVIQVYYFQIIRDLIHNGFVYKGEKYRYFTSSAGQIRTKKCVFIKESVWNKYEKTLMCGLTIDDINANGGIVINKFLAYLALNSSATAEWKNFDIDKTIVVDDFETCVNGDVDYVDDITYKITRKNMDVPIPHMDGCAIMLPEAFGEHQVNKMVRMPWIKGLVAVCDFRKFIEVHNCSPIVKDIYGDEHDIIAEDIQVIFTKSQFKLWKYYSDFNQYKDNFKKYNCTANYTNPEVERIKDATINYQMLQTLIDITDDEMIAIAEQSNNRLQNICSSIDSIKQFLGVTPYNVNQTTFQQAVRLYPNLVNDSSVKRKIRDLKDSALKRYKSGKLNVHGKYTFILPDLYAFCEWLFLHEDNPKGLLNDGEVFCWLFRKNKELDCLRSPHLFIEHRVVNNVACEEYSGERKEQLREWFQSNGLYTSTHDLISKVLVFDCDGDTALVVSDKTIVDVAKRTIDKYDIVPLQYSLRKANPIPITNESIYDGITTAFTGGNIGIYSNNISKVWNSETFISGTEEEKKHAIDCVKQLCAQNNQVID